MATLLRPMIPRSWLSELLISTGIPVCLHNSAVAPTIYSHDGESPALLRIFMRKLLQRTGFNGARKLSSIPP